MSAERGQRARGRGRGTRGGGTPRGGSQGIPLAAQMRQVQRLDEPAEMRHFRRFSKLKPLTVESVYGPTGLLETKLRISSSEFRPFWGLNPSNSDSTLLTLVQCERALASIEAHEARERALSRRSARLPSTRHEVDWDALTGEEKELLLLSNAEYARRHPAGNAEGGD